MAYTYNDFVSAAKNAGVMDRFTQSDLAAAQKNPEFGISLTSLLKDIGSASTTEKQLLATEAANQLRKNYGVYSTNSTNAPNSYAGSYGSTIEDLMAQLKDYGSYNYANQDAYQGLLDSIVNQQPFSYDAAADPSFSAYKKAYAREGERASANAMAQASAASGGRASSYAMTAAQQAGNYYAGKLTDMLPTLEQAAYSRYLSDFSNRLSSLSALESDRNFDMQNWMNQYNMMQNSLGNYQNQDATDYQRYLDAQAQEQQKIANALALYQTLGYATPEVAKILGLNSGSSGGYSGVASSGGGGSGGGGGGSGYDNGGLSAAQIRELQKALGVTADGKYGKNSRSAAGGLSAAEAYAKYVTGGSGDLYGEMINDLQGSGAGGGDSIDYSVTNKNGSGWIQVGSSRMTWTELEKLVNQGKVIEVIDKNKGTITYKYKSTSSSNTSGSTNNNGTGSGSSGSGTAKKGLGNPAMNTRD